MTKNYLAVAYSQVHCKSIVLLARSPSRGQSPQLHCRPHWPRLHWVPAPAVSPGPAKSHPRSQEATAALFPIVSTVWAATNSPLVTRFISIASAGQWVAYFLHLDRPGPRRGSLTAPWLPAATTKNFDQFHPECGRGGAGRDAALDSSHTKHASHSHSQVC